MVGDLTEWLDVSIGPGKLSLALVLAIVINECFMIPEVVAETSGLTKKQITELVQQAYDRRMKA
ncbi:hypothetical protein PoB_003269000, partial [Plakobranchus ocellatus]